jgi:hypothetical protein
MKMRKKGELPTRTCLACGRPMAWRKRWAKDWDAVKYCSDRCRNARGKLHGALALPRGKP